MRLPLLLVALLPISSCDPGVLTQVIIHYRSDYLAESAALVRITSIREGLEDIVVEKSMLGLSPQAAFPLQVPLEPTGGDSTRRFRVVAEFEDAAGVTLHRRETIGGFVEGRRLEVVVRLDQDCEGPIDCEQEQTCVMGTCQASCVLPVEQEGRDETPSISCAAFRKPIQLVGFNVSTVVEGLPVVVTMTDPDLASRARPDGRDIAFADMNGAALAHELVSYDPEDGSLIAWVLAPKIRPDAETEFFIYFDGASAPVIDGAVWSGFEGVWHFDQEDGAVALDRSSHGNTFTRRGRAGVPGVVHRAQEFPGEDADPDGLYVFRGPGGGPEGFDFSATDSFSISLWAKIRAGGDGYLVYRGTGNVPGFKLTTDVVDLRDTAGIEARAGTSDELKDEWTLVTLVVDRTSNLASVYRNGEQEGPRWLTADISELGVPVPAHNALSFGGAGGCCFISGLLDELWVERAAWSQARIRAMFHNQRDPSASIRVGELEALR